MKKSLCSRLDKHFTAMSALAAAAAVGGFVHTSSAGIVYSGPVSINIPSTTAGVYLNVVTGVNAVTPAGAPGWDVNFFGSTALTGWQSTPTTPANVWVSSGTSLLNLASGTIIDGTSSYAVLSPSASTTAPVGNESVLNGTNLYGFKFINEADGNQIHYGWVKVAVSTDFGVQPRTITEYAFEDVAGQGIAAGATLSDPNAGACCKTDGTCATLLQADCTTLGGSWTSAGTTCASAGCATRCCKPDGTCAMLSPTDCAAASGVSTANSTCAAACPQPGACCKPDGTCTDALLPSACTAANGIYEGAVTCASITCPTFIAEAEPNETKGQATVINFVNPGDFIKGNSTGAATTPGTPDSQDTFLVATPSTTLGIYRHRLTIQTSGTAGHTGTIRGLNQTGATAGPWTGSVGLIGTTDSTVQTSSTTSTPARMNQWYGFGKHEQIYYRVTGGSATTADYNAIWTTTPVTPTNIGSFQSGQLTISTVGQGHTTDTDLWVYDANLNAINGYGNDGSSTNGGAVASNSTPSWLRRDFTPGTYYLALSNTNLANNKASPSDDNFRTGLVLDKPNAAANSSTTTGVNVAFAVTDSVGTTPFAATRAGVYDVQWFTFTVTGGAATGACCLADGTCQALDVAGCTGLSGTFSGIGVACGSANCPQPGACCVNDGTCSFGSAQACVTLGGIFAGGGVTCATAQCNKFTVVNSVPGTFTDITGIGTAFTTLASGSLDDGTFAFTSSVTNALVTTPTLFVGTNGDITNLQTFTGFSNTALPSITAGLSLALYPMWDDLDDNSPSQLLHLATTENSVPVEIIQWNTFHHGFVPTGKLQVKIFGAGGPALAQYIFQDLTWNFNGNSATIGVQWAADRAFQYFFGTNNAAGGPIPNNAVLSVIAPPVGPACYPNCDNSTAVPFLNVGDFTCFLQKYAASDPYANCDASTQAPTLNVQDFTCFLQKFAAGCSAP